MLETIRSRAPVVRTQPIDNDDIDIYICQKDRRAAALKLSNPKEYAELIMAAGNGIGTALEYLEPKTFAPVKEMRRLVAELLEAATQGERSSVIFPMLFRGFSQKRDTLIPQLTLLLEAVNDLMLIKNTDNVKLSFFADRDKAMEIADRVSMSFLYGFNNAVLIAIDNLQRNSNVRLTLVKLASDAAII